ncbi:MAG: hypothetical protein JJLCMIEE_03453 [Acidimicrobiales bacterium]|nr:hypothetical protein [Acidimicrobiales bacterium]
MSVATDTGARGANLSMQATLRWIGWATCGAGIEPF